MTQRERGYTAAFWPALTAAPITPLTSLDGNHLKDVTLQRAHLHHLVKVLVEEIEIQVLGVESGDEEFAGTRQVNGIRGGRGQRAMPQLDELDATLVPFPRILEHLVRLHIQEAQPHGAVAHDALQMAHAAAAAIALARIQRHHHVAAFPNSFAPRINAKADAVAERPDANEAVQISVRCGQPGGQNVGVVVDVNRRGDAVFPQRLPPPDPAYGRP